MKHIILICLLLLISLIFNAASLKLLLVFPIPSRSHYILGNTLGKSLANLGHDVTILSTFEEENPPKNYKNIVLDGFKEVMNAKAGGKPNMFEMESISPYFQTAFLVSVGNFISEFTLNHTKVQTLLKSDERFDAVIIEQFWDDALKVFAYHFDCPLIAFSPVGPNRWVNNLVSNPENPSYIPDLLLSFSGEMTFYERLYNTVFGFVNDLVLYNYFYPSQNAIMQKYFPGAPHLNDIQYNVSLVLTNSHESIHAPVPKVPNMINIGGYHVEPPKELAKDLKNFMDNSEEGVIYFSLGSNLEPSTMPKDKKNIILKVLGSRKERVLWKWDEADLKDKPSNVMISKWFPQQSVLAHPNCKLFISHGGLLSLTETVSLGVPVLAFPIFGDQKLNAAIVKEKGFGLTLPFSQITEEALVKALDELLSNPSYREKARLSSQIIHDRPLKPIEEVDYWIKYIVRHRGAPHLRVAAINLPLYKYYLVDVFAVILGGLLLVGYLTIKLCGLCCGRKKAITEKTNTNSKKSKNE